jgi:peptidylprolyl isomerase
MASDKGQPAGPDRRKMLSILIPAVGIGLAVIVIAVIAGMAGGGGGRPMSDGSDGSATDPQLVEMSPGVKVRDLKEGTGDPVGPQATVKVHYTGWLTDGTVFDSSKDRGAPAEFALDGVIVGWKEGIPGMRPGGIRKLVIAPEKGYGAQKRDKIPANSTLIFEVELLGVVGPKSDPKTLSDGTKPGDDDPKLIDVGDGLKVRDLKEGQGDPVRPGATVVAHYTGWLLDGKVFDSSHRRGEPSTFSLNQVIAGWQKGLQGMRPGGVRKLVIPSHLGYGARGTPDGSVPPNATLVFEVELVRAK